MNFSTKLKTWFKKDWKETKTLFRCLPALPFAVLCGALIAMNILVLINCSDGARFHYHHIKIPIC